MAYIPDRSGSEENLLLIIEVFLALHALLLLCRLEKVHGKDIDDIGKNIFV